MNYLIALIIPFSIVVLVTPVIIMIAKRTGMISQPQSDRWHSRPTALLGGIGIFIGVVSSIIWIGLLDSIYSGLVFGAVLIFISGLYDDVKGLRPYVKLIIHIIAGVLVMTSGVFLGNGLLPGYIAIPITLLWVVGITNAMNLLDNMDGLCSGISGIIGLFLGIIFLLNDQSVLSLLSFTVSGAAFGFLVYNFSSAKIFMGDSGSLFLGFLLSTIALMGTYETKSHVMLSLGIPLLVMSLPIFDTTLVTISRKYFNRPISQGGRDHSSHRLIALGYSERKSLLVMYGIAIFGGGIAIGLIYLNLSISLLLVILSLILFVGSGAFLSRVKVYSVNEYESLLENNGGKRVTLIRTVLQYKRQIVEVLVDSILVMYSLYLAAWLQYNGEIPHDFIASYPSLVTVLLPYSLIVFLVFRFYSDIWRYLTVSDSLRFVISVGVLALSMFLFIPLLDIFDLKFTTVIIFAIVLFLLLSVFRLSERLLYTLQRAVTNGDNQISTRILLVGAGDTGSIALREIIQNKKLNFKPVGFVDDDPSKKGARIDGYPVMGSTTSINDIVASKQIDKIIISITDIGREKLKEIYNQCENTGKPVMRARISFDPLINTNFIEEAYLDQISPDSED
jgi:UDP-GlcNAc:undecaprenyl-phosphate GlcNAc-1-phosphate transferase